MKSLLRLGGFLLLAGSALLLAGCATGPLQALSPTTFYKRDMIVTVAGITREGVIVVPRDTSYDFQVQARGTLDLFTMDTCHREQVIANAGQSGLFGDKKLVEFSYAPVRGLETSGSCPMRLGGYEKIQGRHSWAIIDFEDPATVLPANIKCNGEQYQSNGVTICQSKIGLIEEIIFPVEVFVSPTDACPMPLPADSKTFLFPMPAHECVYNFLEKTGANRQHRLTTVGYESVLVR